MNKKPGPDSAPRAELRKAVDKLRPYFVRAAVLSVFASVLLLAPSAYMLEVYDRVVNSRSHTTLGMLTLLVIGTFIVMEILEWARTSILQEAGTALDNALRARVFNLTFEASLKKTKGGTAQTLTDLRIVRDFIASPAVTAMMEAPIALLFLVLIFAANPWLGWFATLGALVQTWIAFFNQKRSQPPLAAANMASISAQQYADSTLRNAQVIESMGMLKNIHRHWYERQHKIIFWQAQASDIAGTSNSITRFWQLTISSGLLGLGALALLNNSLNGGAGMMIVASILGGRVLAPLVQIVAQWQGVVNARSSWNRLEDLLETYPLKSAGMALPPPRGQLSVENLYAGPPNSGLQILRGLTFELQPAEVLAVVGPSASGKTTLARMLAGLWPALAGNVRLDGANLYQWNKEELGPHVGYLPQGVELFDGTIAENIARFGEVDMALVHSAAHAVGLHDLILELPEGYDTPVGHDGATLSGGQRQRIGLARAVYGQPAFVVLDEPNASLDEAGDRALAQAISYMKAKGTTFVIMTHRASILAVVDKMLVLRDGQNQAFGPRDEVLAGLSKSAAARSAP